MLTYHFVMTSSLLIKILKIEKLGDFSCNIDYNSRTDVFREVIFHIINQCDPRRPKCASGGHKVSASSTTQASEARLYIYGSFHLESTSGHTPISHISMRFSPKNICIVFGRNP